MLFKKGELKLLWSFYLCLLIYGLSTMIFPFIVMYFLKTGYTFLQISIINFAFGVSMFLFEIPTGAFADGFSRKYSVIAGFLIVAICVSIIAMLDNFTLVVFLWAIAGIGLTFVSGAQEAWVIDNLNYEGRSDLHQEYFIKSGSFLALGSIFAPILGAIIVKEYPVKYLWFVLAIGFLVNAVLMQCFTKEHFTPTKLKAVDLMKKTIQNTKIGIAFSLRHKTIFLSFLAGLFMLLMIMGKDGRQPFLVELGMAEYQLGYVYSIAAVVSIAMSFLSRRFSSYKPKTVMATTVIIRVILLFSLLFVAPPLFLIASSILILNDGLLKFAEPITQTYLHTFIPKRLRATTMSVKNMMDQLVIAFSAVLAGGMLDLFGPQKVIAFGALFGIIAVVLYQKIKD
jgi:MFS family permease